MDHNTYPLIPEVRSKQYAVDVISERTGKHITYLHEANEDELKDLVVFYHQTLEEINRKVDALKTISDASLGFDDL